MEEVKVYINGKENAMLTNAVLRFYEIIKDRNEPDNPVVNLDLDSKVAKEIYYQTALLKELLGEVRELKQVTTKLQRLVPSNKESIEMKKETLGKKEPQGSSRGCKREISYSRLNLMAEGIEEAIQELKKENDSVKNDSPAIITLMKVIEVLRED
ncbi:MAG: hypothetical protein ACLTJG_22025 [[Clostridium] innocuum]